MATTIEIEFDYDMSDDELKIVEDKINKVLRGEAVPAPEVEGQRPPPRPPIRIRPKLPTPPRDPRI